MRRKRRSLSADDLAVWSRLTEGVSPLARKSAQPAKPLDLPKSVAPRRQKAPPPGSTLPAPPEPRTPPVRLDLAPDPMAELKGLAPRTDKRTHARLSRGKLEPDARIDLHGMTAARAHAVLVRFLLAAHARGDRLVLVITGKGRAPDADALSEKPGVLRREVPHWLAQAPLGPLVLQVMPAHIRHGGAGAYYVYLRRRR